MTRPYKLYRPGIHDKSDGIFRRPNPDGYVSREFELKLMSGDMIKIGTDYTDNVKILKFFIYKVIMPTIIESVRQIHLTVMNSEGEFRELDDDYEELDKLDLEDNTINVVIQDCDSLVKDYVSGLYSRDFLKIKYPKKDWDMAGEIMSKKSGENMEMMWEFFTPLEI